MAAEQLVLLPSIWASILSAVVLIGFGIFVERHYLPPLTVLMNVIFTFITLASVAVPLNLYFFFVPYLLLGAVVLWRYTIGSYYLFGTKVFGSFCLALSLFHAYPNASYQPILQPFGIVISSDYVATSFILFTWVIASLCVTIVGHIISIRMAPSQGNTARERISPRLRK